MPPAELVKRNVPATTRKIEITRANAGSDGSDSVAKLEGSAAVMKVLPYVATTLLGAFLFGYHLGVVNAALEYLAVDIGIASSTVLQGLVVSITLAGAFAGSVVGGSLNDTYGRCKSFMIASVPLVLGGVMCAYASSANLMLVGRLLCGLGIGLSSCVVPCTSRKCPLLLSVVPSDHLISCQSALASLVRWSLASHSLQIRLGGVKCSC